MKPLYKLDPPQHQATHPEALIWVNANAGTGKTTVLTSRVLKLLLAGTRPSKILCLTYTKAAASEMQNRIIDRLRHWVTLDDAALRGEISTLTGFAPSDATVKRARGLFIEVLESAEGLNVQTIHSYAQSLLRRFPIEAGVSPYFRIIDEQESALMGERALQLMLQQLHRGELPELEGAAAWLIKETSEDSLKKILQNALQDVMKWKSLIDHPGGIEKFREDLAALLDIPPGIDEEELLRQFTQNSENDTQELKASVSYFTRGGYTLQHIVKVRDALALRLNKGLTNLADTEQYIRAFLTKANSPIQKITKFDEDVKIANFLQKEQRRVHEFVLNRAALRSLHKTLSYYALIDTMFAFYRYLSAKLGVLDYQQLLIMAERLLTSASKQSGWVMYKMDGGLEHILVDEAQDTSPEQWRIIQAITEEFFTGETRAETTRTLFIVGDEKQSIFSFQGADVGEFRKMKAWFEERASYSARALEVIALEKSYRSAGKIIDAVNAVAKEQGFEGIHLPKDAFTAGKVVMLPVITKAAAKENSEDSDGQADAEEGDEATEQVQVALGRKLALMIRNWLAEGKMIESEKRAVRPEDIMVLVKRRSALVQTLSNELKRYGIAVQGTDRLVLKDYLAVQDMVAFGRWLTLPEDDYALACILRSPIGGLSEQQLFDLAYQRKSTLWASLQEKSSDEIFAPITALLKDYLGDVDYIDPYQLFYRLLIKDKKMRDMSGRLGSEAIGILQEFLNQAMVYQAKQPASMQGFIQFVEENDVEIKRNNALAKAVRIMTVHGAKGLESPIVILADTADAKKPWEEISWIPTSVGELPVCIPDKTTQNAQMRDFSSAIHARQMQEYQRLLYVAITRARDEFVVTGYRAAKKIDENSWYALLDKALAGIAEYKSEIATESIIATAHYSMPDIMLNPAQTTASALPNFLIQKLSAPVATPRALKASELMDFEHDVKREAAQNLPSQAKDFGVMLHGCIEAMFAMTAGDVGQMHIDKAIRALPDTVSKEVENKLATQLANLIAHESTAFLFKHAERLVETPMAGVLRVDGVMQPISATIDLCILYKDAAWLVDFKTSEKIPNSLDAVPKIYTRQLALYRHFLSVIFPEKTIRAALVWTAAPLFQEITSETLEAELLDVAEVSA